MTSTGSKISSWISFFRGRGSQKGLGGRRLLLVASLVPNKKNYSPIIGFPYSADSAYIIISISVYVFLLFHQLKGLKGSGP